MTGQIESVPAELYYHRRLGVASKSALDQIAKSPAHYRAWVDGTGETTPAMAFGSALHCMILEPERWAHDYAVKPDGMSFATKDGKAWRAENVGRVIVPEGDVITLEKMASAVRQHPVAGPLFRGGEAEVTLRWRDDLTDLECQARVDYWRRDLKVAVDLKSTSDASPREFARACAEYRYHIQHAFYADAFFACGEPIESFLFVAVEKTAPYLVAVYQLDGAALEKADACVRADLDIMADCLRRDEWPGYPESIQSLSLPGWAA